jgi:signal transduction histidine kinase/FixJ family two-component response regulator
MKERILLVDDEPGIRRVLRISLEEMGYQVDTAANGTEALRIFQQKRAPIVLTDIKMPGMDGIDVLKRIKQENPETEVIVITGHGDMDLAIRSLKNEASDFITKPVDDAELENALRKSVNNIRLRHKLREYTEHLESLVQQKTERLSDLLDARGETGTGALYRHFFDEIPGYTTVLDRELRITAANRKFKEDFDFEPGTDAYCYQVLKHQTEPCAKCPARSTLDSGDSRQFETEYVDRRGDIRKVMAWTSPIRNEAGRTERVMVMSTDVTRILDLKDHLSSLGLMVGSVSHGIKGLLTGLDAGVYLLDTGVTKGDAERVSEGLETVKLLSGKIKNMVLDILYYAKERKLNIEPVEVGSFFDEIVNMIEPKISQNGIAFEAGIQTELRNGRHAFDSEQIQTALVNILDNAMQACLEDLSKSDHRVGFWIRRDAEGLTFDIEDNGTGMDAETREKIFTLFFSSKSTRGTGIGLFVTQNIIRQHGGQIHVDSEPGRGTRFSVLIPNSPPDTDAPKNGTSVPKID